MKKSEVFTAYLKQNAVAISVIIVVIAIAVICIFSLTGEETTQSGFPKNALTSGVPEFDSEPASVSESEDFCAVYYENVSKTEADEYAKLIERECGVTFGKEEYPMSASLGDRIVTLQYGITEMRLSVTFVKKTPEGQENTYGNQ